MKPLIVLLISFFCSILVLKWIKNKYDLKFSARIAMSIMLVFTALGHFIFTKGMALMLPDFIPFKKEVVYFSGGVEVVLGIGLLFSRFQRVVGGSLILFFILVLPVNIYAAFQHVDYQNASFNGVGLSYLWFRIPLQVFFIAWVYFSTFYKQK